MHSNRTPQDETASAAVAGQLLTGHLPAHEVAEVQRLVMLTAGHHAVDGDPAGQRVCDADLSGLGAEWERYAANVAGIRRELPGLSDQEWRAGRTAFLTRFLARDHLFASAVGRDLWEARARENLARELSCLA